MIVEQQTTHVLLGVADNLPTSWIELAAGPIACQNVFDVPPVAQLRAIVGMHVGLFHNAGKSGMILFGRGFEL